MRVYVSKDGQQFGPYAVEQLLEYVQQGNFTAEDLACHDGKNWVTIAQVPGFAEATQPAATPSPTTPQRDQAVQEHAAEQQPASANASNSPAKKKKLILWTCIGGGATLLVAGLLIWLLGGDDKNPDQPTFVTGNVPFHISMDDTYGQGHLHYNYVPMPSGETRLLGMWEPTKRVVIPEVINGRKVVEIANFSRMMSKKSKKSKKSYYKPHIRVGGSIASPFGGGGGGRSPAQKQQDRLRNIPRNNITEEIVIPGTVRIIKNNAFDAFPKLKKITFSEGLVEIEDDAFASCRQLEAVEFPRSLRKIGPRAFNDCDKLHSIVLKEGLETIGDHAFSKTSPKKVIFPNSLKSLGLVFEDCRELEAIVFLGDRPVATGKRISQRTRATVYYNPLKKHWGKRPTGVYMGRLPVSTTHHYMMNLKNGRPWGLYELTFRGGYKDNEMHGLCTWWYKNGQKKKEGTYKDGQPDGLFVEWYPNGQKKGEGTYKDGQPVTAALVWKPNGEKCPATNLVNGNGVVVVYNDDGTEDFRITFLRWPVQPPNKNGEPSPAPAPAPGTPRPKPRTPPKKVSPAPVNPSTSEVVGKLFTIPDLSMDMLWVKPGTFEMGSPSSEKDRDDDETQHTVTLTSGFYLGKHEVTQAQWEKVMGSNPSYFKGASRPVEKLSWNGASAFCEKLTELERKAGRLPEGMSYQLPTEAQWEYACRAGD